MLLLPPVAAGQTSSTKVFRPTTPYRRGPARRVPAKPVKKTPAPPPAKVAPVKKTPPVAATPKTPSKVPTRAPLPAAKPKPVAPKPAPVVRTTPATKPAPRVAPQPVKRSAVTKRTAPTQKPVARTAPPAGKRPVATTPGKRPPAKGKTAVRTRKGKRPTAITTRPDGKKVRKRRRRRRPGSKAALAVKPVPTKPKVMERPNFVEGELQSFMTRAGTRRNFIGVRGGISAIPNDTTTVINSFFLEIEPQADLVYKESNFRLGLGVPLRFELADTQGPVETCIADGRLTHNMGGTQDEVMAATGVCLLDKQDKVTENFGRLREADWDEPSDFARIIRYLVIGKPESSFYFNASRLFNQSLGHGTVVRRYNPNIDFNTARLGATLDFNHGPIGAQVLANDVVKPDVIGFLGFLRPLRPFTTNTLARSLSFGFSFVHGSDQPRNLRFESGLFGNSFDQPIPRVDETLNHVGGNVRPVDILGGDVELKVLRHQNADIKLYADYQKISGLGGGLTFGSLVRLSFGAPATMATRARLEIQRFDANYMPNYFDTFHDIFANQYLPMAYTGSNGLTYYPTKLGYLEANTGGPSRLGFYGELTHTIFDRLTVAATIRGWRASSNSQLAFPDFNRSCADDGSGNLDCSGRTVAINDPGFTALRLRVELPFRRFLQAFAAYEVFSSNAEDDLGVLRLDGDNEILFSGVRLMLLPVLFLQAEARRYFFLQRVANVDIDNLVVTQDQNMHSSWTYAVGAYVGYEFN